MTKSGCQETSSIWLTLSPLLLHYLHLLALLVSDRATLGVLTMKTPSEHPKKMAEGSSRLTSTLKEVTLFSWFPCSKIRGKF